VKGPFAKFVMPGPARARGTLAGATYRCPPTIGRGYSAALAVGNFQAPTEGRGRPRFWRRVCPA
jgi:hypothetical protein